MLAVTRGGPQYTSNVTESLPIAGIDQGDGTAALLTVGNSGGGGASNGIVITTTQVLSGASPVQITQTNPMASRFEVLVKNTGGATLWIGGPYVTDSAGSYPGYPMTSGESQMFPLSAVVPLFAYVSTGGVGGIASAIEFQ